MVYTSEYMYLKGVLKGLGLNRSLKSLALMYQNHKDQMRNDGNPYYSHPVKVASYLIALKLSEDKIFLDTLISVALLHDVIEDCENGYKQIKINIGEDVAELVETLSKSENLSDEFYYSNIGKELIVSLVKCSDRCHNVSTMAGVFKKERLEKYVDETEKYVLPLVRKLRDSYPDISDQMVIISYQIKALIQMAKFTLTILN